MVARILLAATTLVATASLLGPASADAHNSTPGPVPGARVLTTAVTSPENLEIRKGKVLVADSYLDGLIARVKSDGALTPLLNPAKGITGLALSRSAVPGLQLLDRRRPARPRHRQRPDHQRPGRRHRHCGHVRA